MSYQSDKITQMAARFLQKANGRLPYIVLIKLMYYADKKMLLQYGEPITFDRWVSMKNGPVLSNTLNLIKMPDEMASEYWSGHVRTEGYDVVLRDDPGDHLLSELEEEVIDQVYSEHGDPSGTYDDDFKWRLVEKTHGLPEWDRSTETYGGYSDITYRQVLKLAGVSDATISQILDNIAAMNQLSSMAEAR
jgi:uncharacterized phage-associated protein